MSTPSTPQHSAAGGVNSNLPPADAPPLEVQYPDPATHAEDPRWEGQTQSQTQTPPAQPNLSPPPTDPTAPPV